jgi:hypothetical protein
MTADCKTLQPALERRLLGEASAEDLAALAAHCVECAECRALCATDSSLMDIRQLRSGDGTPSSPRCASRCFARRASTPQRRRGNPAGGTCHQLRFAFAGAAALGALHRRRARRAGRVRWRPWRATRWRASASAPPWRGTTAHDALESPFTYANVSVRTRCERAPASRIRRLDARRRRAPDQRPRWSVRSLAQTLLARRLAARGESCRLIAVADRVLDSRAWRDALAESAENDPSAVVRLKAFAELADRRGGDDGGQRTSQVALRLLTNERSVRAPPGGDRLPHGNHVDRAALRRALDAADPATRGPLLVRASQYLQTN